MHMPEYERMLAANVEWARDFQGGLPVAPGR